VPSDALAVRDGDEVVRLIRLGAEEDEPIGSPLAPLGGETRVPSLVPPPEVPPEEPDDPPADPPDELELPDVVGRGPACAHAVAGTASASTTAIDPNACIDLVMASAPLRQLRSSACL